MSFMNRLIINITWSFSAKKNFRKYIKICQKWNWHTHTKKIHFLFLLIYLYSHWAETITNLFTDQGLGGVSHIARSSPSVIGCLELMSEQSPPRSARPSAETSGCFSSWFRQTYIPAEVLRLGQLDGLNQRLHTDRQTVRSPAVSRLG